MTFRLNQYSNNNENSAAIKTVNTTTTSNNTMNNSSNILLANNKNLISSTTTTIAADRPSLPRASPPGNFNVNYNTFEVKIPNYTFGRAVELVGAGGLIAVSLGKRNKDNRIILAKLSPHSVRLEREYYITKKLYNLSGGEQYIHNAIEYVSLVQDGLAALLYTDIQPDDYVYFELQQKTSYFSLYSLSQITNMQHIWGESQPPESPPPSHELGLDLFLTFAIECCSALQFLHENVGIHGELRPSAFSCRKSGNLEEIKPKLWNFGGGLNSYEEILLTSSRWRSFMSMSDNNTTGNGSGNNSNSATTNSNNLIPTPPLLPSASSSTVDQYSNHHEEPTNYFPSHHHDLHKPSNKNSTIMSVNHNNTSRFYSSKEFQTSLVYVSPEQTGRTSNALDHRADLYSLGIMFFTILTDRQPFEGTAMDIIHSILSKNVPLVHNIRPDVPPVISLIIDKLTRKTVDERYDSAYGLREDLYECQRRLHSGDSNESLDYFPLGLRDVNPVFKVSDGIFGRQKELELISSIVQSTYRAHQLDLKKCNSNTQEQQPSNDAISTTNDDETNSNDPPASINSAKENIFIKEADKFLRVNSSTSLDSSVCEVIALKGPGGIGKSTMINSINVQARHLGYTASAKFDKNQKRPYNGLLKCLSTILRQLLTESEFVIREFYKDLKYNLGPQFSNVRLMVNMVPELKPILYDSKERINQPDDDALSSVLNTETRFHAVYLNIIQTIARKKLITLCLDDLQEADEPSISLIRALILSRTTMVILLTFRDGEETPLAVVDILEKCIKPPTSIQMSPLGKSTLQELVLSTLYNNNTHRSHLTNTSSTVISENSFSVSDDLEEQYAEEEHQIRLLTVQPLVDIINTWTRGNPFYAKQFLKTMKRKDDIWFDWNEKHWKYRLDNIKKLFDNTNTVLSSSSKSNKSSNSDLAVINSMLESKLLLLSPQQDHHIFDVRNLVSHLQSLELHAQCFLMWASLIGHSFDFQRIKWLMMDNIHSSSSSVSSMSAGDGGGSDLFSLDENSTTTSGSHKTAGGLCTAPVSVEQEEEEKRSNQAMLGLQVALSEGIVQYKVGNEFNFIHDRYYQAASMLITDPAHRKRMHLKIGQMLMMEEEAVADEEEDNNIFLIADHLLKSATLIKKLEKSKSYRDVLIKAGNEATCSGALQMSATYYKCALYLMNDDVEKRWQDDGIDTFFKETLNLYMKILELDWLNAPSSDDDNNGSNDKEQNNKIKDGNNGYLTVVTNNNNMESMISQIIQHTQDYPFERAQVWRIQARIHFQQSQYHKGISSLLKGLAEMGVEVDTNITIEETMQLYRAVKPRIAEPGFDALAKLGPCKSMRQLAIMTLLNEACTGAYWVNPILVDFFALKLCEFSLEYGYTPASGGGFIWVGCTATRVSEFKFAAQLGEFGMALSKKYAGNSEIARAIIVHHAMLAQWTGVHMREYIYQYQRAYKYAIAGGDRLFSSMALYHVACTLYWTSCNLNDIHWHLNHSMEECRKGSSKDVLILNISLWRSVLVFQGRTEATSDPDKLMNDPDNQFDEPSFVEDLKSQSVNSGNPLNWHYGFKMILLYHFGFSKAASDLGFKIFDDSVNVAVHRHVGISMYYHGLTLVETLRGDELDDVTREKYTTHLHYIEKRLSSLADHSEVNYRMYHKIVQTQISTLDPSKMVETIRLYNEVLELGAKGNWYSFLGVAYELAADFYLRSDLKMIAVPLYNRSIEFFSRWGAFGKVTYLKKKHQELFEAQNITVKTDVAIQTEDVIVGATTNSNEKSSNVWDHNSSDETTSDSSVKELYSNLDPNQQSNSLINSENNNASQEEIEAIHEETLFSLDMVDLTSIIKSSQVISNEMNSFNQLLKKMMGIIMANSGAESGVIIIKEGTFGIAAHSVRSIDSCQTFEPTLPLREGDSRISTSIVHYVIHTHTNLFVPNVEADPRFATGNDSMKRGAVICTPILHKNTLVGILYLQANLNAFTYKHANVLALLCDQIGISVTNALLFKSLQKATQANALMIESQLKALEEARASREEALHATKMKSNFLANMSHELRTPFSGFYGMISLLSETRLDNEQREFVSIAKQSCEMLLHIIDDLLDFSKLEAHKVKLHYGLFYIEDLIADRMELLITLATNKNVELSYFIDEDVPSLIYGDGNRIGQILMNLIGNAIKFTHHGEVVVRCSVEDSEDPDYILLKLSVKDTGIGMSEDEIKGLFVPFSQVDGSTTRNFGGTGLGLSICLQIVRLMHGNIFVDSKETEGSTFSFTLRVKSGTAIAEPDTSIDIHLGTINELTTEIGQRRILLVCSDRLYSMIKSFIPWIRQLDHCLSVEEAIVLSENSISDKKPYDYIFMDAPLPDSMLKIIKLIEDTPVLYEKTRILLLIAPTLDNIRSHFANSSIIATPNNTVDLQHSHIFHPLVTRISKPIRRVKLLKALAKALPNKVEKADDRTIALVNGNTSIIKQLKVAATSSCEIQKPEPSLIMSTSTPYTKKADEFTSEELAMFKGQRILIAEDNFIAQRLIVKQLEKLGFVVEKCNNGLECFNTWKESIPGSFVLAWIDHHMPICDGLEATRKIREYERQKQYTSILPIIALTADIQSTTRINCANAGMNDYVTKPLMQKDLVKILRKHCL